MSAINIVNADSAKYNALDEMFTSGLRFDYDALARTYNQTPVDSFVSVETKAGKGSFIAKQLEKRGLSRGIDFDLRSTAIDGKEGEALTVVKRLSEAEAGKAERKPRAKANGGE